MRSASRQLVVGMSALVLVACIGIFFTVVHAKGACPVSSLAANYGLGSGPVYLSGQSDWYSGGQTAIIHVDSSYRGPLSV